MSTLLFALLSLLAFARSDNSYWVYPPNSRQSSSFAGNIVLQTGSVVEVKWYSNISTYSITLWQQYGDEATGGSPIYDTTSGLGSQSWNWTVNTSAYNSTISPVYFLWLNHGYAQSVTTSYFNVTAAAISSSSASSSSSGTSSTIASTASAMSSSALSTTPASSGEGQSSSATTIGLGVGLGVGIPLVLLLAAFFGFQVWRSRRSVRPRQEISENYGQYGPTYYAAPLSTSDKAAPPYTSHDGATKVHEAPETRHADPSELSG